MRSPESDPGFWDHPVHGYEAQKELICRVMRLVRRGYDVAVDVGAHIGVWSHRLAMSNFRVHAFEPDRENYECLYENTQDLQVRAYPYGLGDANRRIGFTRETLANSGMWHVTSDEVLPEPAITTIDVVPLDSQGIEDVGLLKLDVEGYEGRVLMGAEHTIRRDKPVIVFEDNGIGRKYFGTSWTDPKDVLRGFGYIRQARVRKDEIWLPG